MMWMKLVVADEVVRWMNEMMMIGIWRYNGAWQNLTECRWRRYRVIELICLQLTDESLILRSRALNIL